MGSVLVPFLFQLWALAAAATWPVSKPGCQDSCGNVSIPYPFGIGPGCFRGGFEINCTNTTGDASKPFYGNKEVINISLPLGEARVYMPIAVRCYSKSGSMLPENSSTEPINLTGSPFRLSDTRNKFTAIGCDTLAYIISDQSQQNYTSRCLSICWSQDTPAGIVTNESCSGFGCCQTAIPEDLSYYKVRFDPRFNHTAVWSFNPCSYAFVADENWYRFDSSDLDTNELLNKHNKDVPTVLDWAIRNETCENAKRNASAYACVSEHSECINSTNGLGYLCNCWVGYQGNPYLNKTSCQDIDECTLPDQYPCSGICNNTAGNYICSCPPGWHGDPTRKYGCVPNQNTALKWIIGFGVGICFLFIVSSFIYLGLQKRKLIMTKQRFFEQNGGLLLQQQMNSQRGLAFKLFTKKEIERATKDFEPSRILGRGGHGTVYKGILDDKRVVAIKRSKEIDERQTKEFAKEMFILSQINHKNVVKILGCCLEVKVPILVYEYISNGTLFQYIHGKSLRSSISLDTRLSIAAGAAEALAYLHSSASTPIIHGDVKSANILLDDMYMAKVSDFGASKLAPMDETQLATLVQGTCGYLDPEYLQTCQLTEKSDVYSFGVVLLELLTGKKAVYFERLGEERSLASSFISAMKDGRLDMILDEDIKMEGEAELLQAVAEIAQQCLSVRGDERPTMKEMAYWLENLRKSNQHP